MGLAEQIAGVWVADKDMHPTTNIWAREYWAKGDISGTFLGYWNTPGGIPPKDLFWHFPTVENEGQRAENAEMQAALGSAEIASNLTDNGDLWKFWAQKASDILKRRVIE
jgi:hypothetical protein